MEDKNYKKIKLILRFNVLEGMIKEMSPWKRRSVNINKTLLKTHYGGNMTQCLSLKGYD